MIDQSVALTLEVYLQFTQLTPTATIGQGTTQAAIAGTVTETANGFYSVALTAADMSYAPISTLVVTAPGVDPQVLYIPTEAFYLHGLATNIATTGAAMALDITTHTAIQADAAAALTAQGYTTLRAPKLDDLDAAVSSRLATTGYTAPDNGDIAAIKAKTDALPTIPAAQGDVTGAVSTLSGLINAVAGSVWTQSARSLTTFGTLAADTASAVWGATTRTLSTFGTLVSDAAAAVWAAATRTITSGGLTTADVGDELAAYGAAKTSDVTSAVATLAGDIAAYQATELDAATHTAIQADAAAALAAAGYTPTLAESLAEAVGDMQNVIIPTGQIVSADITPVGTFEMPLDVLAVEQAAFAQANNIPFYIYLKGSNEISQFISLTNPMISINGGPFTWPMTSQRGMTYNESTNTYGAGYSGIVGFYPYTNLVVRTAYSLLMPSVPPITSLTLQFSITSPDGGDYTGSTIHAVVFAPNDKYTLNSPIADVYNDIDTTVVNINGTASLATKIANVVSLFEQQIAADISAIPTVTPPSVVAIRQEMDSHSTQLAAIIEDINSVGFTALLTQIANLAQLMSSLTGRTITVVNSITATLTDVPPVYEYGICNLSITLTNCAPITGDEYELVVRVAGDDSPPLVSVAIMPSVTIASGGVTTTVLAASFLATLAAGDSYTVAIGRKRAFGTGYAYDVLAQGPLQVLRSPLSPADFP